jgi:hypothetical protein
VKQPHNQRSWWYVERESVHSAVLDYVATVEAQQADIFDRFVKLDSLYDPNNTPSDLRRGADQLGLVTENVIASNIDTVAAVVAATDVRARFMTDDGDWSTQRTARGLELYSEGLCKLLGVGAACRMAFKMGAALKGTGLVKVYATEDDEIRVEHVLIDNIVVDEVECRHGGSPKQLHQRQTFDRDELIAQFPEHEDKIRAAQRGASRDWRSWADYRPLENNEIVVIESWRLPFGKVGSAHYKPGRHTIVIDGCDLLDEEWHKPAFPFAVIRWSERANGWYGIGLAERIAGHQRALNKRNWQIDRQLDQLAVPTTYVSMADANLTTKSTNRLGTIAVIKGSPPVTVIPQAVSGETYKSRDDLKSSAYEESGVSRMAAQSVKPAGIDSGVAMREYRDQTTQRFAMQEKAFERLWLDVVVLVLDCCKDLGKAAPVVSKRTKFGARKIKWSDVDMQDVQIQIVAASTLSRTPAGRFQLALEWAQAGVISTDEWRRLTEHPDLDRVLSLYTQGIESIEKDIETIEDGEYVTPEPFANLQLAVRVAQMAYLRDRDLGAPEEVLEGLRQYSSQAAELFSRATAPANDNMPMDPAAAAPSGQPVAALAPEAMNLMAG